MLHNKTFASTVVLLLGATAANGFDVTGPPIQRAPTITSLSGGGASTKLTPPVIFDSFPDAAVPSGTVATATGSTPNTFMGDAYNLAAGANSITGFDIFPVN